MTLRIKITHDSPGYPMTAVIKVFDLNDLRADIDAKPKEVKVLSDGQSSSFYVYDIQQIVIEEGPALAVDNGMPSAPAIHGAALANPPIMNDYTEHEVARMPADAFVQPGEMRSDGTIQTEAKMVEARESVRGQPLDEGMHVLSAPLADTQPPVDDAFVAVGATRFSDGQIQTEESLATAKSVWAISHP